MLSLGLDIGTTSISLAVTDENNTVIDSVSLAHNAFIDTSATWERLQDGNKLIGLASELVQTMVSKHDISCIGVTGQQHGIAYLDREGNIVSPLYTWQDARALQSISGKTILDRINEKTGYTLHAGYGLATHCYNVNNNLVPSSAVCLATVPDIAVMRLTGRIRPVTDASNAHSLGLFRIADGCFDAAAVEACGMEASFLPELCTGRIAGLHNGIPVSVAIGDNQASFIGAVGTEDNAILVNFGTGSQISLRTDHICSYTQMELRPFPLGGYLLTGASLCGGRAWAITEKFFRDTVRAFSGTDMSVYAGLDRLLDSVTDDENCPVVHTCFDGTRADPEKRGSIIGLSVDNFDPGHLALGVLHGMTDELFELYRSCLSKGLSPKARLIGSGNGLRLNKHLRRVTAQTFGIKLEMADCLEEASVGAAKFASLFAGVSDR